MWIRQVFGSVTSIIFYDVNQINTSSTFYQDLLAWWSTIREVEDPNNVYKYIIWNNKEIKVDGKSVFYKYYFNMNIKYTNDLLFDKSNIESFNVFLKSGTDKVQFFRMDRFKAICSFEFACYFTQF